MREQIQNDISNQLVWTTIENQCQSIVLESLGQLESGDTNGTVVWSISSWARGELLELVQYKDELVGIDVDTVNPWEQVNTPTMQRERRNCCFPRNHEPERSVGHFYCSLCGYECDRDVVGALNVERKHFDQCKMEEANPVACMEAGNHASFPLHRGRLCSRSTRVQSTTESGEQDMASSRQTSNVSSHA